MKICKMRDRALKQISRSAVVLASVAASTFMIHNAFCEEANGDPPPSGEEQPCVIPNECQQPGYAGPCVGSAGPNGTKYSCSTKAP
jgi:hypothetical protein